MDTGQPLVIGNGVSDHHKVYYTYIGMYFQKYMHYFNVLISLGRILDQFRILIMCTQERP